MKFGCTLAIPKTMGFKEYLEAGLHEATITTVQAKAADEAAAKYLQMQGMNSGEVRVWDTFEKPPYRIEIHDAEGVLKNDKERA